METDELIDRGVTAHGDVGVHNAVLFEDVCDEVFVQMSERRHTVNSEVDATALFGFEHDIGRLLVQTNAETLQLFLHSAKHPQQSGYRFRSVHTKPAQG